MLSFLKKIFGPKTTEASPAPYKVEPPVVEVAPAVKKAAKTPAVKKATARKPRTPKA